MAEKVHYTAHAELDKPDGFYHCGETAVCKVDFYRNGDKYNGRIRCRICIENKPVFSRKAGLQGEAPGVPDPVSASWLGLFQFPDIEFSRPSAAR